MSRFYDLMTATATRLIGQYGATGTLTRVTTGEYDEDTGSAPTTTEAFAMKAVVLDYSAALIDGSVIQVGDKKVLLESAATAPLATDRFSWQGVDYQIIKVKPLAPSGQNVMFELQVRR